VQGIARREGYSPLPAQELTARGSRAARWTRSVLFGGFSVALHLALVASVGLGLVKPAESHAAPREEIDVSVVPALGMPHGVSQGVGLGSHIPVDTGPKHAHRASHARHDPDGAPTADKPAEPTPGPVASSASPAPTTSADSTTPAGSANVAPAVGSPDGQPGGTAPPRPRMTSQYAGVLAGWFGARLNLRGLGIPPEELKGLSVRASISIAEDRRMTGFSLSGSSGNAAYDEQVRRTLASIQGSGVPLPEPPDGTPPPLSFTVRFRPMVIH
jgi:hypothetical protein